MSGVSNQIVHQFNTPVSPSPMNKPISAEQALRDSLEAATLSADDPVELMRLLQ
jgi:hypothetical protein